MKKTDYIDALRTLLDVDSVTIKDMENLKTPTLAKIFNSYIENAKRSADLVEELKKKSAHVNTHLPPVDIKVLVKCDDIWVETIRHEWITSKDGSVLFQSSAGAMSIPRGGIKWMYA